MTTFEALVGVEREITIKEKKLKKLEEGNKTNHILHLILSIVTAGLWLIVWLFVAMSNNDTAISKLDKELLDLYALKKEAEYKIKGTL